MKHKMRDKLQEKIILTLSHKNRRNNNNNNNKKIFLSSTRKTIAFNLTSTIFLILILIAIVSNLLSSFPSTNAQKLLSSYKPNESLYTRLKRQIFRQSIPQNRPLSGNLYAEHHGFPHPGRWHANPQGIVGPNQNSGHHFESPNVILTDEDFKKYGSTLQHIDEMIHQKRLREDPEYAQQFQEKELQKVRQNEPLPIQQYAYNNQPQQQQLQQLSPVPPQTQQQQQYLQPGPVALPYGPPNYQAPEPVGPSLEYQQPIQPSLPPLQFQPQQQPIYNPPPPTSYQSPSVHPPTLNPISFHPPPPSPSLPPPSHYGHIHIVPQEPINNNHIGPTAGESNAHLPEPQPEIIHHGDPNPVIPVVAHYHYNHNLGTFKGMKTVKYLPGTSDTKPINPSPQYGEELFQRQPREYGARFPPLPPPPAPQYGVFDIEGPAINNHAYGGTSPPAPDYNPPVPVPAPPPPLPFNLRQFHQDSSSKLKGPYLYHIHRPLSSYGNNAGYNSNTYRGYLPVRKAVKYSTRIPGAFSWSVSY